jgi:two-component system, LuxR family, sensor kinase FixL
MGHVARSSDTRSAVDRSTLRILSTALLVCAGYYVGANIGFVLRFPPATPSVMWPPNAILTATLLLTVPRKWWIYLLAALPAHLAAELGTGLPAPLALALFATNCSEALVAAVWVRRFSDAPARFDTLRRTTIFIVGAGFVAPFVSSFVDAAAVAGLVGEPYWLVWRTRFFSNVLTELTLVPALVIVITAGRAWLRSASARRRVEAAVLGVGLIAVALVVLAGGKEGPAEIPDALPAAFLLPFLLWAAVRFGPGGASLSLLTTTLIAIWAATQRRGPFGALPLNEGVFALQIFLTVVAIPLLCLSALIEERRRAEAALAERLRFEELLSRLAGAFVHRPIHEMNQAIATWLQRLGTFLGLDRFMLVRVSEDARLLTVSHSWTAPGSEPVPAVLTSRQLPEGLIPGGHDNGGPRRIGSDVTIPLETSDGLLGGRAFYAIGSAKAWPDELVQRVRLVSEVFANALARQEAEEALRTSESMKSAILSSLSSHVAVLDRAGLIIAVNEGWTRHARERGVKSRASVDLGANYLDVYRERARDGAAHAIEVLAGIQAVLNRSRAGFSVEYPCRQGTGERWFAMAVVPLNRPEGGVVVSHTEITERKRAEVEAQRSRQELAHFTRVSTMGELTASLAHELNQPLTGILTNAQAARRFLEFTPPDLGEIRNILADIIDDDKRAAEVIQRLRDLLRKSEADFRRLDLNAVVRDVVKLLGSDTIIRNVVVSLDLGPEPPFVNGDPVQLQQVVLNLLLNAMEAVAERSDGDRTIVVRTQSIEVMRTVRVSVEDAGPGLRPGTEDLVFEPFYTTKPAGMGMGLAIARSIIEAHGGLIWAANSPVRGASLQFTLPLADERSA